MKKAIAKLANVIKQELPTIKLKEVKVSIPSDWDADKNPYVIIGDDNDTFADMSTWTKLKVEGEFIETIRQALKDGMTEIDLTDLIQGLDDDTLGGSVDNLADRANSWVEKFGNKIINLLNWHAITRAVAPIVLYNTTEGIKRMVPGTTVNAGVMQINVTSLTEELLVPAYAKYVALFKEDGSCVQADVYGGSEQRMSLNLTQPGNYNVIISCVDYYGFVINKKYNITVN